MASKQPTAPHPGRKRVEERNPKLVDEMLQYAAAHGATLYGVHPRTIERAIERHYADPLRVEVAEANEQVERLLDQCSDTERQLALARAELADAHEQLGLMAQQALDTALQLTSARDAARIGYEPPSYEVEELREQLVMATVALSLPSPQLYAVQALTDVAAATRAVRDGAALGDLQGQLVAVRRLKVYDRDCGWVQSTTVLAEGACVCTADGLTLAGLPVPAGAQ